jgi:hypothetical protein
MNLAEIKQAIKLLTPVELTELAAFARRLDGEAWDRQIDVDFAEGGRLRDVLEEVRSDLSKESGNELP